MIYIPQNNVKIKNFQYHGQPDNYKKILRYFNTALTSVFTVEAILKILAFGVRVSVFEWTGNSDLIICYLHFRTTFETDGTSLISSPLWAALQMRWFQNTVVISSA